MLFRSLVALMSLTATPVRPQGTLASLHNAGPTRYRTTPDASVPARVVDVDPAKTGFVAAATLGSVGAVASRKGRGRGTNRQGSLRK